MKLLPVFPQLAKSDLSGYLDVMEENVRRWKPDDGSSYVLMPIHEETRRVAEHESRSSPHCKIAAPPLRMIEQVDPKHKLTATAARLGLPIPKTFQVGSFEQLESIITELSFPVFLKLPHTSGGIGLHCAASPVELRDAYRETREKFDVADEDRYPIVIRLTTEPVSHQAGRKKKRKRRERDEFELALIRQSMSVGRPVLGICRGCQLVLVMALPTDKVRLRLDPDESSRVRQHARLKSFLLARVSRFLGLLLQEHRLLRSGRNQLDGQLVELAGEAERRLVVVVVHAGASVDPNIEGLINRNDRWDGVRDLLAVHLLTVYRKDASAALGHAGTVIFEVKYEWYACPRASASLPSQRNFSSPRKL